MSSADPGRRVPPHGSGPASLPPAPNRGEGTVLFALPTRLSLIEDGVPGPAGSLDQRRVRSARG